MPEDKIISEIRAASRELMRQLEFLHNLSTSLHLISEWHTLVALETRESLTMSQLADHLNLKNFTITRIVARLLSKKLCRSTACKQDKRNKLISLTNKGKLFVEQIHTEINQEVRDAIEELSVNDIRTIHIGLTLYAEALKNARERKKSRSSTALAQHSVVRLDGASPQELADASVATQTVQRQQEF